MLDTLSYHNNNSNNNNHHHNKNNTFECSILIQSTSKIKRSVSNPSEKMELGVSKSSFCIVLKKPSRLNLTKTKKRAW